MAESSHPVAVVTGAGSGIGRAAALMLAQAGYDLALAGRTEAPLRSAAQEISDLTGGASRTLVAPTDVAQPDDVRRLIAAVDQEFGRIDALVNNAGCGDLLPIDRTDLAVIRRAFDTNAIGPALAIHLAWPILKRRRSGCIVNVSTAGTADPFDGFFAYAASKASVNLMARSCAKEGKRFGIRAFSVAPGAVETPLLRSIFSASTLPASACMTPDDVARIIVDCIAGRRDRDNGRTIFVVRNGDQLRETIT